MSLFVFLLVMLYTLQTTYVSGQNRPKIISRMQIDAGGAYGLGLPGEYKQAYIKGEISAGPGFLPVSLGFSVSGMPVSTGIPYELWVGVCTDCYRRWLIRKVESLLGGEDRIRYYHLLKWEYERLDSLLRTVDTTRLSRQMEFYISEGDTQRYDSLLAVYEWYQLVYRRYRYVAELIKRLAMDTALLRRRYDHLSAGALLRQRGSLPGVTAMVERLQAFRLGRFMPALLPAEIMYPLWVEGFEGRFKTSRSIDAGFFAGRAVSFPYGYDSIAGYWSGGVLFIVNNTYSAGGYAIVGRNERQYLGFAGVNLGRSRLRYSINVYFSRYIRNSNQYILVQEGVADTVDGRWTGNGYGGWGEVVYSAERHRVGAGVRYYGGSTGLRLLPNLPPAMGVWYASYAYAGKTVRLSTGLTRVVLVSSGLWIYRLLAGLRFSRIRLELFYSLNGDNTLKNLTHVGRVDLNIQGAVSPALYLQLQKHSLTFTAYTGGASCVITTKRVRHKLSASLRYSVLRLPAEGGNFVKESEYRYTFRYSTGINAGSFAVGPYVWYFRGTQENLTGGVEISVVEEGRVMGRLWIGGGIYREPSLGRFYPRFDSGIKINWQWG